MAEKTTSLAYVTAFSSFKSLLAADTDHANLPRYLKNVRVINRGAGQCLIKSTGASSLPAVSSGLTIDEYGGYMDRWTFDEVDTHTTFVKRLSVDGTLELVFKQE